MSACMMAYRSADGAYMYMATVLVQLQRFGGLWTSVDILEGVAGLCSQPGFGCIRHTDGDETAYSPPARGNLRVVVPHDASVPGC